MFYKFLPSDPPTPKSVQIFMESNATSKHSDASKHGKEGNACLCTCYMHWSMD